jgi:hypothetical protein
MGRSATDGRYLEGVLRLCKIKDGTGPSPEGRRCPSIRRQAEGAICELGWLKSRGRRCGHLNFSLAFLARE